MRIENLCLLLAIVILLFLVVTTMLKSKKSTGVMTYILWGAVNALTMIPTVLLMIYQITRQYHFVYVYEHIDNSMRVVYRISALWAGQQGSLLLWSAVLTCMGYVCIRFAKSGHRGVLGIYAIVAMSILILTLCTNPFKTMESVNNGLGLAESLKDPWMVVHPPLVFIGYTGMAIVFSLTPIVNQYTRQLRWWIRFSYVFLGLGIFTGSVWAYRALGFGGYWSWDPIENIAFVPWLILCAYLHGNVSYTKVKCIIPFGIAALGTFLTRSGVLQNRSVHAYASADNRMAYGILILIVISILLCTIIVMKRRRRLKDNYSVKQKLSPIEIFRILTYLYGGIILVATVIPIIINREVTTMFFNLLSVIYIAALIVILIWYLPNMRFKNYLICIIITTILVFGAILFYPNIHTAWLILSYCCILPVIILLVSLTSGKMKRYIISHLLLLIMILGVITSSGFTKKYIAMAPIQNDMILFRGEKFTIEQLNQHKTHMVHEVQGDFIITNLTADSSNHNILISYESKPLITLFWLGGFGLLGYSIILIMMERKKKR